MTPVVDLLTQIINFRSSLWPGMWQGCIFFCLRSGGDELLRGCGKNDYKPKQNKGKGKEKGKEGKRVKKEREKRKRKNRKKGKKKGNRNKEGKMVFGSHRNKPKTQNTKPKIIFFPRGKEFSGTPLTLQTCSAFGVCRASRWVTLEKKGDWKVGGGGKKVVDFSTKKNQCEVISPLYDRKRDPQ